MSHYDVLNRINLKSYSGGVATPAATYCYDGQVHGTSDGVCVAGSATNGIGQLTQLWTSASVNSYTVFDSLGRAKNSSQSTNGSEYNFSYTHNRVAMTSKTYPSGRTVTYQFDTAGRVKGVLAGATNYAGYAVDPLAPISYAPNGGMQSLKFGNALVETTSYNSCFQPTEIQLGSAMTLVNCFDSSQAANNCAGVTSLSANNNGNVQAQTITGTGPKRGPKRGGRKGGQPDPSQCKN